MESSSVWKPNCELSPNCPRCGSSNTKFCYYNNYSLTQPRYFCKGCRRYWTKGGSLRNVPVGGGCRKNRRSNKNLRQSIHEGLNFKNSTTNNSIGQTRTRSSPSSSSSVVADGPNIDLALVYANFLNQKPNSGDGVIENKNSDQLQQVFDLSNIEGGGPSTNLLHEEFGLVANNQMCLSGFNSMEMHQKGIIGIQQCSSSHHHNDGINFELPPLPGDHEDQAATHDDHLMWSTNPHEFQATHQPPFFGPNEAHDDADLLIGNWSPFDLPRDSSFSRP